MSTAIICTNIRSFQTEISYSSSQQFDLHPYGLRNYFLSLYEVKKEDRTLPIFTPGSTRTSKVNKYRQKFCFLIEREILKCTTHKKPVLFFNSPFKNCTLNSYKSATELKVGLSLTCQIKHCAADTFPGSAGSYPCHS